MRHILCLLLFLCGVNLTAQDDNIFIAVVGGTSFGDPASFGDGLVQNEGSFSVETKAGTSPTIYQMRYNGVPFYYIRMYGAESALPDEREGLHHIRTWLALYDLGVTHVLGGASSGGIRTDLDYDDLVIIDDFMEMEVNRPQSILRYANIERPGIFANFANPFSPSLRKLLIEVANEKQPGYTGKLYTTGTFVQHNPERFETAAEIRAIRILGGDLTSLNIATCAVYARQLGIRFAALCSIANPAVGVRPFTFKDMQESVQRIAAQAVPIVLEVIGRIPTDDQAMAPEPISTGEVFQGSYTNPDSESHRIVDPQ
jgi:5'-methylthioadenosine phosphorylase